MNLLKQMKKLVSARHAGQDLSKTVFSPYIEEFSSGSMSINALLSVSIYTLS